MPDTITGWALLAFDTLGSLGGIGFIAMWAYVGVGEIRHRQRLRRQERQRRGGR